MTEKEQRKATKEFLEYWKDKRYEFRKRVL